MSTSHKAAATRAGARHWRLAVGTAAVAMLVWGSAVGSDDWYPFAPMTQFAGRIPADVKVRVVWVEVTTTTDGPRRLDLGNADELGLKRIELTRRLDRFTDSPAALAPFAQVCARLHPDRSPLTRMTIGKDITTLRDAEVVKRRTKELVTWEFR